MDVCSRIGRYCILIVLAGLLSTACVPFLHPGSVKRNMDGSYDQVFQATLSVLHAREFPIERADREKGRIITGRRPVGLYEGGRQVETVDARIERDDGTVRVRLLLGFFDQRSNPPPKIEDRNGDGRTNEIIGVLMSRSVDASAAYDAYLDAIEDRVEDFRTGGDS